MFKKSLFVVIGILLLYSFCYAQETVTITTYYPAPYGVYQELRSQQMAIGATYYNPNNYCWPPAACGTQINANADLVVEGNVGIGTTSPQASLDLNRLGGGESQYTDGLMIHRYSEPIIMPEYMLLNNFNGVGTITVNANNQHGLFQINSYNGTTNLNRFTIGQEGNVGIGTVTPRLDARLTITNDAAIIHNLALEGSGGSHPGIIFDLTGTNMEISAEPTQGPQDKGLLIKEDSDDLNGILVSGESVRLGNVGIGTLQPRARLQVGSGLSSPAVGDIYVSTQGSGIILRDTVDGSCHRVVITSDILSAAPIACP